MMMSASTASSSSTTQQDSNASSGSMGPPSAPPAQLGAAALSSALADLDPNDLGQVLKIFQKYNLKESEEIFKRELSKKNGALDDQQHKDKEFFFETYDSLVKYMETAPELIHELSQVFFPIFIHFYMEMMNRDYAKMAHEFFDKFASGFTANSQLSDLRKLRLIHNRDQLARSELRETYCSTKYNVKLCKESFRLLKDFVKMKNSKQLVDLIKENVMIDLYSEAVREPAQQAANLGGLMGESNSCHNTSKLFYGLLKEPELNAADAAAAAAAESAAAADEAAALLDRHGAGGGAAGGGGADGTGASGNADPNAAGGGGGGDDKTAPAKRRKNRRDALLNKKNRPDPNAPPFNRVPLPEMRDIDRLNRQQQARDFLKRARLGADKLPSICFYTMLNAHDIINCCDLSDDSTWLVLGLADSTVRVCTLSDKAKLRLLKPLHELELLDKEADDVLSLMFDDGSAGGGCGGGAAAGFGGFGDDVDHRTLVGHSGPVYGVSFSPDKFYLVSCSEDATVRLWCLLTYSCLVSYKGHNGPVWDVRFGPYGHYFASCGIDRTARVWASDQYQPVRLYAADHLADVECVCFHPNCNYLASGSADRTVRIFDLASTNETTQMVRQYTGHKDAVNVLKFSTCGRFLVSGGADALIIVWDISTSVMVAQLTSHTDAIYAIDFSRDNTVFATGGLDNTVKLWNMGRLLKEVEQAEDLSKFSTRTDAQLAIGSWRTKQTPLMQLHFTRRNLLVGLGVFKAASAQSRTLAT